MWENGILYPEEKKMKQKIVIVSHCFFNDASKLSHQNREEQEAERKEKRIFLQKLLQQGAEIMQLPCPEFLLYGSRRWGHASSQFDTPFFRKECEKMLEPFVMQWKEYRAFPDRFEIIGIVGIDGSPSCGINATYDGDWGGEFQDMDRVKKAVGTLKRKERSGIFMEVLKEMMEKEELYIPMYSMKTFPEFV